MLSIAGMVDGKTQLSGRPQGAETAIIAAPTERVITNS
jgi:hypothetical protein